MTHPSYERIHDIRIQVLRRPGRVLVALLELLSPTNKTGDGFNECRGKRNELLAEKQVHLVELDLLVGGKRLPTLEPLPRGDHYAFVSRANQRPRAEVYAWTVRQPLPAVPIPLAEPEPDISIDLGAVFSTAYERGHYAESLDYDAPLKIPLAAADVAWAQKRARSKRRSG